MFSGYYPSGFIVFVFLVTFLRSSESIVSRFSVLLQKAFFVSETTKILTNAPDFAYFMLITGDRKIRS